MKLLIAIQSCFAKNIAGMVFVKAWANFLNENADKLDCDFVFMNNGSDLASFRSFVTPHRVENVPNAHSIAWDTDSSFRPFEMFHQEYDFILRVDHDAFLTVDNINKIIDFLNENPTVDFVSATNFCRPITNSADNQSFVLDNSRAPVIRDHQWAPWMYPTHNSDLYIIRSAFFRQVVNAYSASPYTPKAFAPCQTPFDTANMNYSQVCHILGWNETRFPSEFMGLKLRIDGSINTDFWTILCSLKPVMAGIVNHDGRSFRMKNHLVTYGNALAQNVPFDEVIDVEDYSFPHELNIRAPYLHTGNGYITDSFFDQDDPHLNNPNMIQQFKDAHPSFAVAHFCFVLMLARSSGNETICGELHGSMRSWMTRHGINYAPILERYKEMYSFFKDIMAGYINEENLQKYSHVLGG